MANDSWERAFARLSSTDTPVVAPKVGLGRVVRLLDDPPAPVAKPKAKRLGPAMLETCECLRRYGPIRVVVMAPILNARRSTVAKRLKVLEAHGMAKLTEDGWRAVRDG